MVPRVEPVRGSELKEPAERELPLELPLERSVDGVGGGTAGRVEPLLGRELEPEVDPEVEPEELEEPTREDELDGGELGRGAGRELPWEEADELGRELLLEPLEREMPPDDPLERDAPLEGREDEPLCRWLERP